MIYLTKNDFIAANAAAQIEAGSKPFIREPKSLDYIAEYAKQAVFGHMLYETVLDVAVFYFENVVKKHVFNDANKRTSVLVLYSFLELNDVRVDISTEAQLRISDAAVYLARVDGLSEEADAKVKKLVQSIML